MFHTKQAIRGHTHLGYRKQRGVALIFTAFILLALVAAMGLAIDVGRLYAAQQNLQTAADIAALETARFVGGCREPGNGETLQSIAQAAVNRNFAARAADDSPDAPGAPTVSTLQTGFVTATDGIRSLGATPAGNRATGVALTVTDNNFNPLFTGLFTGNTLTASAGARSAPIAGLALGTSLATVDPDLLGDLLGINLAVASMGNLATSSISLGDLLDVNAGVVTTEDVARLTVNDALENIGDTLNGSARTTVNAIRMELGDAPLSEIFDLAGPTGSDVSVSVGALVNSAAQLVAADRQQAIAVPLNITLPVGLGGITANLRILEPPQTQIGPAGRNTQGDFFTTVRSAQVALELRLNLELLATAPLADLPIVVNIADGDASLSRIVCPTASLRQFEVDVEGQTSLLTAGIGSINTSNEFEPGSATLLAGLVTVSNSNDNGLSTVESRPFPTLSPDAPFVITNPDDLPMSRPVGDDLATADLTSLLSNISLTAQVGGGLEVLSSLVEALDGLLGNLGLGGLLGGGTVNLDSDILLAPINDLLQNTLAGALAPALDPLLASLGINLGGGTVAITSVDADQPSLFCSGFEQCFTAPGQGATTNPQIASQ